MMKVGRFFQIALLILLAAGAQPASSAFWQWSKTSSSNATADPSINWSEGMSPSSVNDSARAMMARAAEYRDDISGLLQTTGGAVNYSVTTNQGLTAIPPDGQQLSFRLNVTNGVASHLAADGGFDYPLETSPGVAVSAGAMIAGAPYRVTFNLAQASWLLHDSYQNVYNIPLGGLLPYTGTTVPNGNFVFPSGQCLSTTTYAAYWALLGSPASGACAGGQFQVIDVRGRAVVALDTLNGVAANRLTAAGSGCGTAMTFMGAVCANGVEGAAITLAQLPAGITSHANNSISVTSTNALIQGAALGVNPGSASGTAVWNGGSALQQVSTNSAQRIDVVSDNTGGNTRPQVGPSIGVTYILRVL